MRGNLDQISLVKHSCWGTISVFQEHSSQFRFCFCLHRTRQLSEAGIGVDAVSCWLPDPRHSSRCRCSIESCRCSRWADLWRLCAVKVEKKNSSPLQSFRRLKSRRASSRSSPFEVEEGSPKFSSSLQRERGGAPKLAVWRVLETDLVSVGALTSLFEVKSFCLNFPRLQWLGAML